MKQFYLLTDISPFQIKQFKQWHNKLLLAYRSSSPESRPDDLVNNAIISYENI